MDTLTLAKELIMMDSSTSSERTIHIAKYIKDILSSKGFDCALIKDEKNANLIAEYGKNPELIFSGHMDTVDPDFEEWKTDPWKPVVKEKKLFGLGSCDMKSQIASVLTSVLKNKLNMKKGCKFVFSYDEENGFTGIKKVPKKYFKGKYCIVCEPTKLNPIFAHKGIIKIKLKLYGKSAHGSEPWKGVNSLEHLIEIYNQVKSLNKSMLNKKNDVLGSPVHNLGILRGGRASNIVPSKSKIEFEYRLIPEISYEKVKSQITSLISNYCKKHSLKYNLEFPLLVNAFLSNKNSVLGKTLKEISKNDLLFTNYTTEAPIFQSNKLETFVFGPGGGVEHQANEYIELDQIKKSEQMYSSLIKKFC